METGYPAVECNVRWHTHQIALCQRADVQPAMLTAQKGTVVLQVKVAGKQS